MHGMIKAMLIKELLENNMVVGYQFKKMLKNSNIEASNGAIYYNLKKFEKQGFVTTKEQGKKKFYILTELGKEAFNKNLKLLPNNIEHLMRELGSQVPFINWHEQKDVEKFHNLVQKLNHAIQMHLEDIK